MTDRYREGALQDWEVTATVAVAALNETGAIESAKHLIEPAYPGYADWEAHRA